MPHFSIILQEIKGESNVGIKRAEVCRAFTPRVHGYCSRDSGRFPPSGPGAIFRCPHWREPAAVRQRHDSDGYPVTKYREREWVKRTHIGGGVRNTRPSGSSSPA